jgi:hypothetical protein
VHFDKLSQLDGMSAGELSSGLTMLELSRSSGKIARRLLSAHINHCQADKLPNDYPFRQFKRW